MGSPVSSDCDGTVESLYDEFGADEGELLRDGGEFEATEEDVEFGHAKVELLLDASDFESSSQIHEAKMTTQAVVLGIGVEDVVAPFVFDVHIGPSPGLFDGPS